MPAITGIRMIKSVYSGQNRNNTSFGQGGFKASRAIKKVAVKDLKYGPKGDYYKGDLLFTLNDDWLAETILYFTRNDRHPDSRLRATHVAIIFDKNTCLETTGGLESKSGIKTINGKKHRGVITYTDLKKKYLNNQDYRLFIRRPKDMNEQSRNEFIKNAQKSMGIRYANSLLVVAALRGSFLGHLIDKSTNYKYFDRIAEFCQKISSKLYKKGTLMCSQFTSNALKMTNDWSGHNKSLLIERPSHSISPQRKINADELFEPTIVQIR